MDHTPLWPQCLTEKCHRDDRLEDLQPITWRHPGDRLRLFAVYHDRDRLSENLLTRAYTSRANHDDQTIGSIPVVVSGVAGPGPPTLSPRTVVTARLTFPTRLALRSRNDLPAQRNSRSTTLTVTLLTAFSSASPRRDRSRQTAGSSPPPAPPPVVPRHGARQAQRSGRA